MKECHLTFPSFDFLSINPRSAPAKHFTPPLMEFVLYGISLRIPLGDARHGEYATLMPCDDKSKAPSYILERNINGFYLLNDRFEYDPDAQAEMMNWINQQTLPVCLLHPEIMVKPFDIKLEELALDIAAELEFDLCSIDTHGHLIEPYPKGQSASPPLEG